MKKFRDSLTVLVLLGSLAACSLNNQITSTSSPEKTQVIQGDANSEIVNSGEIAAQEIPEEDWESFDMATKKLVKEGKIKNMVFQEKKPSRSNNTGEYFYKIDVSYPQLLDTKNVQFQKKINAEIKDFVMEKIKDFRNGYPLQDGIRRDFSIDYNVSMLNERIFSFQMYTDFFEEDLPHGNTALFSFNYDLRDGSKVHLADLFEKNVDYLKLISGYCRAVLKNRMKEHIQPAYKTISGTFEWIEEGAGPKEENFSNFRLSEDALVMSFNVYQVGPYTEGNPSVAIPYSKIQNSLNPQGLLIDFNTQIFDQADQWEKITVHAPDDYKYDLYFAYQGEVYLYLPADPGPGDADEGVKEVKVTTADPDSFEHSTAGLYYAKDKRNVYYQNKVIVGADLKTFQPNGNYATDKQFVYFENKKIKKSDPTTFQPLNHDYGKDKNHVYYQEKPIQGANIQSWTIVETPYYSSYSKDDRYVYFEEGKIVGFDPKTFKIIPAVADDYTQDKNGIYYQRRKIVGADAASFQVLKNDGEYMFIRNDYAKDANHIYYKGEMMRGVDPKTFTGAREISKSR